MTIPIGAAETGRVTPEVLEKFTRQLGVLLATGVDMLRALDVASQQAGDPRLLAIGRSIAEAMADGREFHETLTPFPDVFSPFYVQMARRGELDGVLGPALLSVADYLAREFAPAAAAASQPPLLWAAPGRSAEPLGPLVAAPLLAVAGSAQGAAVLWALGITSLFPSDWIGPLAVGWTGLCLAGGGALAWRLPRRSALPGSGASSPSDCSLCGRAETTAGPLARGAGVAICEGCLRSTIEQLKPASPPPEPQPATPPPAKAEPPARASDAETPPSRNGSAPPDRATPERRSRKRIDL